MLYINKIHNKELITKKMKAIITNYYLILAMYGCKTKWKIFSKY